MDFSAFLDMRRHKNWAHKISSWMCLTLWRPVQPVLPRAQRASFLLSTLNSFQGALKVSSCRAHDLILVEVVGKCQWQVPICCWLLHAWKKNQGHMLSGLELTVADFSNFINQPSAFCSFSSHTSFPLTENNWNFLTWKPFTHSIP